MDSAPQCSALKRLAFALSIVYRLYRKYWTSDDVWSMLGCMADSSLGFSSPLEPATIARLSEIYRAGNGGVCGVVAGESGARAACGSRFGCSFCGVTGARDKSMEFMIQEPEHAHLKPLNEFRNYLLAIQWDLSRRELVGRTLSDAGYTRIQADTYRFLERMAMLKMLLSIDANERDRAERHSGELAWLCRSKRRVSCTLTIRTIGRLMTTLNPALARVLKRLHYPLDVILTCVRWYVAYPLSLRHLEEMMAERGISVDHSTVHRWAIKVLPVLEKAFRRHKKAVGRSWRMDETYIKVRGQWKYLYRAVDKEGNTVDFLLRAHRDKTAARRYFEKSIEQNGEPETVTIDKSGANLAALDALNEERQTPIKIRQNKYLNNVVEQDHRAIKRRTRPMLGFKNFRCARILLSGIELMHMITKGQMQDRGLGYTRAEQFYSLAA
ncbi:hypothetical protein PTKU15_93760 [Paraburkholderia terrae]|nr:hypothetical protein PTKU15_93760 [Paraburkholderia terrae]